MNITRQQITIQGNCLEQQEFAELAGVSLQRLQELLALGWLEALPEQRGSLFREVDIYRVRKLERICCDFDLPVLGGIIIVDLLERIDTLECALRALKDTE